MATVHQKIRIYDLAKELKLDNKKVMEDARREGIEVSVPSNTVPHEVAERIRLKYFPKKIAPRVGPRLVKHAKVEPVEVRLTFTNPRCECLRPPQNRRLKLKSNHLRRLIKLNPKFPRRPNPALSRRYFRVRQRSAELPHKSEC